MINESIFLALLVLLPFQKNPTPKYVNPPAKVLSKVYDNGDGRDIHEYEDGTIVFFC